MPIVSFANFSLDVPPDWTMSTLILAGPLEQQPATQLRTPRAPQQFQQNLVMTMEEVASGVTAEDYLNRQLMGLQDSGITRYEGRPPEEVHLEDGARGIITEQIITGSGGEWVRQMQLITIKDRIAHTLIASHLEGPSFERARDQFRAILLSFK